ncbi:MAG TPA: efflux RND transporter periplasmic adaptor subunit [Gemmataceae bacterium]
MKRILASGGFLGMVLACTGLAGCGQQEAQKEGMSKGPPEVYVSAPVIRKISDYEEFPGRLEARATVQVKARVTGYLLAAPQDQEAVKGSGKYFKEGGKVKEGDLLFMIDPQFYEADLALAKGSLLEAKGQRDQAEADWNRVKKLRNGVETSQEEKNKFQGAYVMAEGNLEVAKANLKKAQINMAYTKVLAPLSGTISKAAIDPGNLVQADQTLLTTIGASDPIKATFDLDERTLTRILRLMKEGVVPKDPTGTPVQMWLADQSDQDSPFVGKIDFTDNYVDAATGTLRVRGAFDNAEELLIPGMFVRVRLPIGQPQQAILIAEKALVTDQGQKFVYVVKDEDTSKNEATMEYRKVTLGRLHDGLRVVKDGLSANEKVVVTGLQRVRPGIKVKLKDTEMPVSVAAGDALDPSKTKPAGERVPKTPQRGPVPGAPAPAGPEKGHGKKLGKGH